MLQNKVASIERLIGTLKHKNRAPQELWAELRDLIALELEFYGKERLLTQQLAIQAAMIDGAGEKIRANDTLKQMKLLQDLIEKVLEQMAVVDINNSREQLTGLLNELKTAIARERQLKKELEQQFITPHLEQLQATAAPLASMLKIFASHIKSTVPGALFCERTQDGDLAVRFVVRDDKGANFSNVDERQAALAIKAMFVRLITALNALPGMKPFQCSAYDGDLTLYLTPDHLKAIQAAFRLPSAIIVPTNLQQHVADHRRDQPSTDTIQMLQVHVKTILKISPTIRKCTGASNPFDGSLVLANVKRDKGMITDAPTGRMTGLFGGKTAPITLSQESCGNALNGALSAIDRTLMEASINSLTIESMNTYLQDVLEISGPQHQPTLLPAAPLSSSPVNSTDDEEEEDSKFQPK